MEHICDLFSFLAVTGRTDIPRPDMAVNCLADGVQLDIFTNDPGFDGVIYVKGHSKEEMCRKVVSSQRDIGPFDFKVKFGTCDLVLIDVSIVSVSMII